MSLDLTPGAHSVTLPPGRYLIADPCYIIPDEQWDEVLDASNFFNDQCWAPFTTPDGRQGTVVSFSTAHGDGEYRGNGLTFGVDSGMIGIVPFEDIDTGTIDMEAVHVVEFKTPFSCHKEGAVLVFGYIEINTDESDGDSEFDFGDLDYDF